ncbi:unnamed protein product [Chrysoparadoxa australica]
MIARWWQLSLLVLTIYCLFLTQGYRAPISQACKRTSLFATNEVASAARGKLVTNSLGVFRGRFIVVEGGPEDIPAAAKLCVDVFFGTSNSPWKKAQLTQLLAAQKKDLESRLEGLNPSAFFKAVDRKCDDKMVGFIEVSCATGNKYGFGKGVAEADVRPIMSNLAVDSSFRRCGLGSCLVEAVEEAVRGWGFNELILQVEEDNVEATQFYTRLMFQTMFIDRAARRYDTSGFLLQNVRTSKITMRKGLSPMGPVWLTQGLTSGNMLEKMVKSATDTLTQTRETFTKLLGELDK